jgi:hypothetical protein
MANLGSRSHGTSTVDATATTINPAPQRMVPEYSSGSFAESEETSHSRTAPMSGPIWRNSASRLKDWEWLDARMSGPLIASGPLWKRP